MTITTARLALRPFTSEDLDDLTALDADPAVMRYINGGHPTPREELRDDILPYWLALYDRGPWGFWAAESREDERFLGWFHLRPGPDDPADEPELGYRLVREVWGRGLATEGSRALIDQAFLEHGARRVYATTMLVNVASRRVMEKAGMVEVRRFRADWPVAIPGDEHGDIEYEITYARWSAQRGR